MKSTLTLLALFFAGVIHLQAQQPPIDEPTANETAWAALVAEKKEAAAASPEAVVIKDSIMAGAVITRSEFHTVELTTLAHGGKEAFQTAGRTIAGSTKTGDGVLAARAFVKFWDNDTSGWTEAMILGSSRLACQLASRPDAEPKLKADVLALLATRSPAPFRKFFKAYRSTLPKAVQIETTQKQKNLMLAIPKRDDSDNAWLAEMSADLIALQLDR